MTYAEATARLAALYDVLPDNALAVMSKREQLDYADYCQWAIAPLGTARQWLAMSRLAHSDFTAWRTLNGV